MAAGVNDPVVKAICNEQVRPFCDNVPLIYALLKAHSLTWSDTVCSDGVTLVSAAIPDDTTVIPDGSGPPDAGGDGRRQITGAQVQALEAAVAGFVAQLEANNRALLKVALAISVNPKVPAGTLG